MFTAQFIQVYPFIDEIQLPSSGEIPNYKFSLLSPTTPRYTGRMCLYEPSVCIELSHRKIIYRLGNSYSCFIDDFRYFEYCWRLLISFPVNIRSKYIRFYSSAAFLIQYLDYFDYFDTFLNKLSNVIR